MKITEQMLTVAFAAADAADDVSTEKMRAALLAVFSKGLAPDGYAIVQTAPLMDMLEVAWDALDEDGNADFVDPEDLAPVWHAAVTWCQQNPKAAP